MTKTKTAPSRKFLPPRRVDLQPLVTAAWLYYQENFTQAEVAEVLGISRPSVANLLSRARDEGIVTVAIQPEVLRRLSSATELRERFGLHDVLVIPNPTNLGGEALARSLGKAGAQYLESVLRPHDILGTCWGVGMQEVARALSGKKVGSLEVAQTLGGLLATEAINPGRVAWTMAEKLGAKVYNLHVPQYVASRDIRELFLQEPTVRDALEKARAATLLILGVGDVTQGATAVRAKTITPEIMDDLRARGAVGDLSGRYYDLAGRPVGSSLDERLIALSLDDIQRISPVIAVAGGPNKVEAILGALRTTCVDVLITDERTARAVLDLHAATRNLPSP